MRALDSLLQQSQDVQSWLNSKWSHIPQPIYGSVDLRQSDFKISPVDLNLFPAGFNNLAPVDFENVVQAIRRYFMQVFPEVKKIALVPESHTRNQFYLEHLKQLENAIVAAGFQVRTVWVKDLRKNQNRIVVEDFIPDLIWLNNDLSSGVPVVLQNIEQPVVPPLTLGWTTRLKSKYFDLYSELADEFAEKFGMDAWLIKPLHRVCRPVNFLKREGMNCLMENAHQLFDAIQNKYDEYGIQEKPYVVVKADSGTYGMGVMMIHDPGDLMDLNRKQRTKMSASKGSQTVDRVILQEGIPTIQLSQDRTAETVIYMVGHSIVGGFYRYHDNKSASDNLNVVGMQFEPIPLSQLRDTLPIGMWVAELSLLAAGMEYGEVK